MKEDDSLKDEDLGGIVILKCYVGLGGINCVSLARYKNHRFAFVNTVMKLQIP